MATVGIVSPIASRNIRLFLFFRGVTRTLLFAPYIQHFISTVRGMGDGRYGELQAIYYLTVVLLEVPSGVVADRLGRRWTLALGALGASLGSFACAMAFDYWSFCVGEILLAVGTAFISGADSALLYDSLAAENRQAEYPRAEAAAQALWLATSAVGFLLVDLMLYRRGSVDPTFSYWITACVMLVGVGVALAMHEPPRQRLSTRQITLGAWRDVVLKPGILRLILYSIGVFALLRVAMVMFFNPALKAADLPVHLFGTVFFFVNIVGAIAAWRAGRTIQRGAAKRLFISMPIALVAMFLGLAFLRAPAAALLFCIQGAAFGVYPLVTRTRLNTLVRSPDRRATTLSIESLACRIAFAPLSVLAGYSLETFDLTSGMLLTVGVACLPFLVVPFLRRGPA